MIAALFLLFLLTGVVFGRAVGSVKGSDDVVAMMREGVKTIAPYLVLVFFAAHFVAMVNWSSIGTIIAIRDRKSVGSGKSELVSVTLGGRLIINKKGKTIID